MNNVVQFPISKKVVSPLRGVSPPKSRQEYLDICKKFLAIEDYEEMLLCVMDNDYYLDSDQVIRNLVDAYLNFQF
jgi:hypothetical protein